MPAIRQAPSLRVNRVTSSTSPNRPKASTNNGCTPVGAVWVPGGAQSVHSRGRANDPRSAWRRLRVSTPETFLTFRTTNR